MKIFLYSSVYSCHLFLISSASVRSILFLSFIEPIFAWNIPLVFLIFLKRSLLFPFYFFSISLHFSFPLPFCFKHSFLSSALITVSDFPLGSFSFCLTISFKAFPILWTCAKKSWLIKKALMLGKDWRQRKKGLTEDEMVGWHHGLNGHELEQTPGDGEGQGSVACYSPWGCKESDMTEWLNNNKTSGCFCWCHILLDLFFKNIFILPLFSKIIFAQYRILRQRDIFSHF